MDDKQDVDDDEEVVRVPEGVVAGESIERLWELDEASSEPLGGESESYCHACHHCDSGQPFHASHQLAVAWLVFSEIFTEVKLVVLFR